MCSRRPFSLSCSSRATSTISAGRDAVREKDVWRAAGSEIPNRSPPRSQRRRCGKMVLCVAGAFFDPLSIALTAFTLLILVFIALMYLALMYLALMAF